MSQAAQIASVADSLGRFSHADQDRSVFRTKPGLSKGLILEMSRQKSEPDWMRDFRLKSFEVFNSKPLPMWGPDLTGIDFDALNASVTRILKWKQNLGLL